VTKEREAQQVFLVARNPQPDTTLPFPLNLPLEGGLVLKAREPWPATTRVSCHPFEEDWPEHPEIVEEVPVVSCRRRGAASDLVLDRPRLARSQFVFTEVKGRPAIFWQTQKTARPANPGGRVPRRRALASGFTIAVDSRERYGYRFTVGTSAPKGPRSPPVTTPSGTNRASSWPRWSARAWRTWLPPCRTGLWAFQMQRLAELPLAAVVVEGRYPALLSSDHVPGAWLGDVLARLQVRYPEVQVVFADSRRFAEEWTYRFLAAAIADAIPEGSD
jgi:hypothetical protein